MTISMYKTSAPIFVQFLTSLSAVLDKAAAHAEAKKIDPVVLLNTRLYPDMHPLIRQVREATNHAASACGRAAGWDAAAAWHLAFVTLSLRINLETEHGTRHCEVVQCAKRVRIYSAGERRRKGRVCPYLGCREGRPRRSE